MRIEAQSPEPTQTHYAPGDDVPTSDSVVTLLSNVFTLSPNLIPGDLTLTALDATSFVFSWAGSESVVYLRFTSRPAGEDTIVIS
jgi:hypothetical protein